MTDATYRSYQLQIEAISLFLEGNPYSRYPFGELGGEEMDALRHVLHTLKGFPYSARRRILAAAFGILDEILDPAWLDDAGEVPADVIHYWDHGRWPDDDPD